MKKLLSFILIISMAIGVFCFAPFEVAAKTPDVKYSSFKKNYYSGDTLLLEVKITIPKLTSKSKAAKKINKFFVNLKDEYISSALANAKDVYYGGYFDHGGKIISTVKLKSRQNGMYSFQEYYEYGEANSNGADSNYNGYNFKSSDGKRLSNSNVIKKSGYTKSSFKKAVRNKICSLMNKHPEYFFEKDYALSNLNSLSINNYGLYVKGSKLYVSLPKYVVSFGMSAWSKRTVSIPLK